MRGRRITALLLALCAAGACAGERARLDAPLITLSLDATRVAPGGVISGDIDAVDRSGVIYLAAVAVNAQTGTRVDAVSQNFIASDSLRWPFTLSVPGDLPGGTPIEVTATAIDNQHFTTTQTASVTVFVP